MPRTCLFLLSAALAAFALPAAAQAVLTINVPVEFHSLNEHVQTVRVSCFLRDRDPVTGNLETVGNYSFTDIHPDAGGNYNGTVAVSWGQQGLSATQLTQIADPALNASCSFGLIIGDAQYVPNAMAAGQTTIPPMLAAAPGSTFVGSTLAH